jgi:hypothetical protein
MPTVNDFSPITNRLEKQTDTYDITGDDDEKESGRGVCYGYIAPDSWYPKLMWSGWYQYSVTSWEIEVISAGRVARYWTASTYDNETPFYWNEYNGCMRLSGLNHAEVAMPVRCIKNI